MDEVDYYKYDALASTTKIRDITSNKNNARVLRRLKRNDPDFDKVNLIDDCDNDHDFCPYGADDLGWFGYYIGKNSTLRELCLHTLVDFNGMDFKGIKLFCRGMNRNRSIQKIKILGDLREDIFQMLGPFFQNNHNLKEIVVGHGCHRGGECSRQLSLVLGGCRNKSLKAITLEHIESADQQVVNIIVALSMHPQLEELTLAGMNIGRNECTALGTLLRWTTTQLRTLDLARNNIEDNAADLLARAFTNNMSLHTLNLNRNDIGDNGVDSMARAFSSNSVLCSLDLSQNSPMTVRGCKSLAALIENNNSHLDVLFLSSNNIDNEGASVFAQALANNCKVKTLGLFGSNEIAEIHGITAEGWSAFSKVLCDTTSINKTFLSNHTLRYLDFALHDFQGLPDDVEASLVLNRSTDDKTQIAITKILKNHSHFDLQPFFEWGFKALPLIIRWFEKAASCTTAFDAQIKRMKFSAIYEFIQGMSMVYIEARTRQQLEEIRAVKMGLQWEKLVVESKWEEVERREARAVGRL